MFCMVADWKPWGGFLQFLDLAFSKHIYEIWHNIYEIWHSVSNIPGSCRPPLRLVSRTM